MFRPHHHKGLEALFLLPDPVFPTLNGHLCIVQNNSVLQRDFMVSSSLNVQIEGADEPIGTDNSACARHGVTRS